ncbi:MAG: hypothetical protein ABF904_09255 [Ethanoligenens sp.]
MDFLRHLVHDAEQHLPHFAGIRLTDCAVSKRLCPVVGLCFCLGCSRLSLKKPHPVEMELAAYMHVFHRLPGDFVRAKQARDLADGYQNNGGDECQCAHLVQYGCEGRLGRFPDCPCCMSGTCPAENVFPL